jgi:hypothetical protein
MTGSFASAADISPYAARRFSNARAATAFVYVGWIANARELLLVGFRFNYGTFFAAFAEVPTYEVL